MGYGAAKEWFTSACPPTAIFVINYVMLMGVVIALHELHLTIPHDVALIGFDYIEALDMVEPAITVVQQPIEKIGEEAAHLILRRIQGGNANFPQTVTLNTTMRIRESVQARRR